MSKVKVSPRNPYFGRPDYTLWRRSVSRVPASEVDPVVAAPFRLTETDRVATAGSCFAQHIARRLAGRGFNYLVTEPAPASVGAIDENYGLFSARFGNVYTTLQLRQLFDRAFGMFQPMDQVWHRPDGAVVDPFRPRIQQAGFRSEAELSLDRVAHLAAVRKMFQKCNVFIFTLGLTEGWVAKADRAAVPLAPGVVDNSGSIDDYRFENLEVADMVEHLNVFLAKFRAVNPSAWTILTVSPVPLIATFEDRHVLVSTTYSKSALRVTADMVCRANPKVAYFPSYEIITGPHTRGSYYEDDLRDVTTEGVDRVMSLFFRHYTDLAPVASQAIAAPPDVRHVPERKLAENPGEDALMQEIAHIICDEEAIDPAC
jgi:hypothetical protein